MADFKQLLSGRPSLWINDKNVLYEAMEVDSPEVIHTTNVSDFCLYQFLFLLQ